MAWGYFLDDNDNDNPNQSDYDMPAMLPPSLNELIPENANNNIPLSDLISSDKPKIPSIYHSTYEEDDSDNVSQTASSAPVLTDIENDSFSAILPKTNLSYRIQFHPNRSVTIKNFASPSDFAVGDFVLTEADRGYDIGQIIHISDEHTHPIFSEEEDFNSTPVQSKILRKATPQEIFNLKQKQQRELEAKEICQQKANELKLPMTITATEFQFDGKKLTVYFSATQYIDFRNLVHTLFRIFGTRIWMVWYDGQAPVRDVFTHSESPKRKNQSNF